TIVRSTGLATDREAPAAERQVAARIWCIAVGEACSERPRPQPPQKFTVSSAILSQKGIAVRALSRRNSRRRFVPESGASIPDRIQSATKGHAAFSITSIQSVRRRAPRRRHLVGKAACGLR